MFLIRRTQGKYSNSSDIFEMIPKFVLFKAALSSLKTSSSFQYLILFFIKPKHVLDFYRIIVNEGQGFSSKAEKIFRDGVLRIIRYR